MPATKNRTRPVIDVGAGSSTLVDGLLDRGFTEVHLLDVAAPAFEAVRSRLGARAECPHYIVADITTWEPTRSFELWHDRAVFHFLTEQSHRLAYRQVLSSALAAGGHAIVATFADDGPERCSGLPVRRYSADALVRANSQDCFARSKERRSMHRSPGGALQSFVFVLFERPTRGWKPSSRCRGSSGWSRAMKSIVVASRHPWPDDRPEGCMLDGRDTAS